MIKGLTTEFSGTQLALIELTDWIDLVLFMGLISLFFAQPLWVGILIAVACYFIEILVDNISARMTWQWMVKTTWVAGIGAALVNIIWMYLIP